MYVIVEVVVMEMVVVEVIVVEVMLEVMKKVVDIIVFICI